MNKFKELPQIDKIINDEAFRDKIAAFVAKFAREELSEQRAKIAGGEEPEKPNKIIKNIQDRYAKFERISLQRVINATGVAVHTNLGRSVIDYEILRRAAGVITGYSNLEYSLSSGSRSNRYDYVGGLLAELFGFEDAIVVNNNAGAVFLVLNTFAKGGESVISRGELVEIGGSFRVPEVMREAGTGLCEVGTTNRTDIADYEAAINENTKLILKVHRSNFDIVGFTTQSSAEQIINLAVKHGLIDYYDIGSAHGSRLPYDLARGEDEIRELAKKGASLVSFSGDKIFGSVQAGIILGKRNLIAKLRKNQLLRMLRVDKVIISLLTESIKAYLNREFKLITTLDVLGRDIKELEKMADRINSRIKLKLETRLSKTYVGGGTMPNKAIPSLALVVSGDAALNETKFRAHNVIGRIENDEFLLDLRTILESDELNLIDAINKIQKEYL